MVELLMTYPAQTGQFSELTLNASNLYQWLPEDPGLEKPGLVLAALLAVSTLLLPFTLPHMHERYFFPADVISIVYAFYSPKRFFVPLIVGTASLLSYFPFLFREALIDLRYPAVLMGIALVVAAADLIRSLYPSSSDRPRYERVPDCLEHRRESDQPYRLRRPR